MQPDTKPQSIVIRDNSAPVVAQRVDPLVIIEQRNELLGRLLNYAIQATHAGQWVDQQGKPYPTAAAAEVMARRCAVRIDGVQVNKSQSSDDKGQFYLYVATCTASLPGEYDSIQAIGTCSSRDQFLGTETQNGRVLSEIDEGNIMKAAYSNMVVNAVTRLLGVRNMTWEQLEKLGIAKDGAAHVEYQKGGRGGGGTGSTSDPQIKWGNGKGKRVSELEDKDLAFYLRKYEEDVLKEDPKWHKANVTMRDALKAETAKRAGKTTEAPADSQKTTATKRHRSIWDAISAKTQDPKAFITEALGEAKSWQSWTDLDMDRLEDALNEPGARG